MSSIKLSPKYGVNPTIPVCFWCGEERGEIALLGHIGDGRRHEDIEAPRYAVLDYEPCDKCKCNMSHGFTLMEATQHPNRRTSVPAQSGIYPTGNYVVVKPDAIHRIFGDESAKNGGKAYLDSAIFQNMFARGESA